MSRKNLLVVALALGLALLAHAEEMYSILSFGAKSDSQFLNTSAIQKAIDNAYTNGGGTVYIPAGTFLTGSLKLKSHVSLYLESGATLLGSTDLVDYDVNIPEYRSYTDNYNERSLIYAEKAEKISILGRGTINGQGSDFKGFSTASDPYKNRPFLIRMVQCKNILVRDVTLIDSPMWVQHYYAQKSSDIMVAGNDFRKVEKIIRSENQNDNHGILLKN